MMLRSEFGQNKNVHLTGFICSNTCI